MVKKLPKVSAMYIGQSQLQAYVVDTEVQIVPRQEKKFLDDDYNELDVSEESDQWEFDLWSYTGMTVPTRDT